MLSRMLGVAAGARAATAFKHGVELSLPGWTRPALLIAAGLYLLMITGLNGWFSAPWTISADSLAGLQAQHFLPFFYHYFTSETNAVASVLSVFGMYMPIGLGCWLWDWNAVPGRPKPWRAASLALVGATLVETGNLFVVGRHPDPTNLLLAAASAYAGYLALASIGNAHETETMPGARAARQRVAPEQTVGNLLRPFVGVVLLVIVAVSTVGYPIHRFPLACGLAMVCAWLWWTLRKSSTANCHGRGLKSSGTRLP